LFLMRTLGAGMGIVGSLSGQGRLQGGRGVQEKWREGVSKRGGGEGGRWEKESRHGGAVRNVVGV